MIPSVGETAAGFTAAIRLARFDSSAAALLKEDRGAAFRSFWAMAPVFPAYLYFQAMLGWTDAAGGAWVLVMGIAFITEWCAFLLAVTQIAEHTGHGDRLLRYVAAHNWAQLFAHIAMLAALSLEMAMGQAANGPITFAASIFLLIYQGFIVKAVLGFSGVAAAGIVLLSLVIGGLTQAVAIGVLR